MFGIAQRSRLGVSIALLFSHAGGLQNAQALGIGGHDPVLDAVVNHLDEVAGAIRTAMEVALFSTPAQFLASRRAGDVADARRQRRENRIQALNDLRLAANHHAVAAFQSPDTAARSDIDVVNSFEFFRAPDVVHVIGVAAVDDRIAGYEKRPNIANGLIHDRGGYHQPDRPRLIEFLHEVGEGGSPDRSFPGQSLDRLRRDLD